MYSSLNVYILLSDWFVILLYFSQCFFFSLMASIFDKLKSFS